MGYIPYTTNALKLTPTAAAGVNLTPGGSTWTNGSWAEIVASTSAAWVLAGIVTKPSSAAGIEYEIDIGKGSAGAETVVATFRGVQWDGSIQPRTFINLPYLIDNIATSTRVAARIRCNSSTVATFPIKVAYYEKPITGDLPTTANASKVYPSASNGITPTANGSSWVSGSWVQLVASTAADIILLGLICESQFNGSTTSAEIDIGKGGSGSETVVTTVREGINGDWVAHNYWYPFTPPIDNIASGTRIAIRAREGPAAANTHKCAVLYMEKPL